ncbi:hypothetical protein MLD38_030161 [Melastoma candidum]|nr:hypothetical protein MLD38_030161 [Melastoma candidum]
MAPLPWKGGGYVVEKVRRVIRTVFFVVAMVASLLASSLPVLVTVADVAVTCTIVTSFVSVGCCGLAEHVRRYSFRRSLVDIPLVSIVRSLVIASVYSFCDGPALSHGPYMGTVTLSSVISVMLLSVKACIFSISSQTEAEASTSPTRLKLHLKKSWGMPVLFLSSVVFALGHIVVAYRTSCRARRKLLFHRVDPEMVLSGKITFPSFQKVPRSPTPAGKNTRSDNDMRRKSNGIVSDERDVAARVLADVDSLFMKWQGVSVHYKLCLPCSSPHSLNSTFLELGDDCRSPQSVSGRLDVDRQAFSAFPKAHNLHRSYSIQFHPSPLYAPLLASPTSHPVLGEEIPAFNLDDTYVEEQSANLKTFIGGDSNDDSHLCIVLIHGFGGGVFSWRHIMRLLPRQVNCSVVAFDRPGWGLTSRPRRKNWEENGMANPYKLETQVDLLLSFCSELGFSSVVLVGHDDGGILALKAAEKLQTTNSYNVAVAGLILIGVSLSREVVPAFARILLHTSLGKKHLVRPLLRTEITQVVNRRAWYDATKLTTEVLRLYKAPLFVEGWYEALHEIGKISYENVLSPLHATGLLKSVKDIPTLVIAGAEDILVPLKSSQSMACKLANSRLVAISGCGHLPHEESPNALIAAVSPFITRLLTTLELGIP